VVSQTLCAPHAAPATESTVALDEVRRALASDARDGLGGHAYDDTWTRDQLSLVEEQLHARNMLQALVNTRTALLPEPHGVGW
jgi:hypothetical protein